MRMPSKTRDEIEKAQVMRHVLWNLDEILMEDERQRRLQREYEADNKLTEAQIRRRRLIGSRTAGVVPMGVEDLFNLYPTANKRFVQALYEANGSLEGMEKTVEVLADLKKEGVFDEGWNPDEDADVQEAKKATGIYSMAEFDT